MDRFDYFAYGSNMLTERLAERCESAKPVGTEFVDGYGLEFSKRSKDKSGKATIINSPGKRQYGVIFTIEKCELEELNTAEGLGNGYDIKCCFPVTLVNSGVSKTTVTYIATDDYRKSKLIPYDWYLAYVVAGAIQHKLPQAVVTSYKDIKYQVDQCQGRKNRELGILEKADLGSIEEILGSK